MGGHSTALREGPYTVHTRAYTTHALAIVGVIFATVCMAFNVIFWNKVPHNCIHVNSTKTCTLASSLYTYIHEY